MPPVAADVQEIIVKKMAEMTLHLYAVLLGPNVAEVIVFPKPTQVFNSKIRRTKASCRPAYGASGLLTGRRTVIISAWRIASSGFLDKYNNSFEAPEGQLRYRPERSFLTGSPLSGAICR